MAIIAIDPGASGAIAYFDDREHHEEVKVVKMPKTHYDFGDEISRIMRDTDCNNPTVYFENVGGYRPGNSGPASVKFARHIGQMEGVFVWAACPVIMVTPLTWMKTLGSVPKEKKDRKNWIKLKMQQRYPHLKPTLSTADALGLLTYAMEKEYGSNRIDSEGKEPVCGT